MDTKTALYTAGVVLVTLFLAHTVAPVAVKSKLGIA